MTTEEKFKNVYNENLFIIKLLTTYPEFLNDVKDIREKIKIPKRGFKNTKDKDNWYEKIIKNLPSETACPNQDIFFNSAENLVNKYKLRYNFFRHIENYLLYGKIDAPKYNFDVSIGPDPRGFRSDKWISIKAYAPLTKIEIREATKKLLSLQKEFLPEKVTLDLRPKIDIDKALMIEKEMKKRGIKKHTKYEGYLSYIEEAFKRGSCSKEEFEKAKKLNPQGIKREIEKYTSREISFTFFKTREKDHLVRQIYSRLKKKREQLFG